MTKINFKQTAENCRLLNMSAFARVCDVTPPLAHAVIRGKYKTMDSPRAKRVLAKLREIHFLAEVPDDGDVNLAA